MEDNTTRLGIASLLRGVHHVGVTVADLPKALEFYVDVLGGQLALSGDGFEGETLHHTLFQRECLDALEHAVDVRTLGVPSVRNGAEKLDVRLISFGSVLVELLHFREAKLSPAAPSAMQSVASSVGFNSAVHICFAVKEEIDLGQFALALEAECRARAIPVTCNRTVEVHSEAERQAISARAAANRLWNDPSCAPGGAEVQTFGDFEGLGFFYCKGPNGEQLEFAQATRKAKVHMQQSQARYAARSSAPC